MRKPARAGSIAFSAGSIGGFVSTLAEWALGRYRIPELLGVSLAPQLTPEWIYPRIVCGGVWGLLFLLPIYRNRILRRGLLLSLGPSLGQLLVGYPHIAAKGLLGMGLGALTPVFVMLYNALWGITAAAWIRFVRG